MNQVGKSNTDNTLCVTCVMSLFEIIPLINSFPYFSSYFSNPLMKPILPLPPNQWQIQTVLRIIRIKIKDLNSILYIFHVTKGGKLILNHP